MKSKIDNETGDLSNMKNSGSKNTENAITSSRVDRCYGNGISTGIEQTASGKINTAFVYEDIPEFTTTSSVIWLVYQSNLNVTVDFLGGSGLRKLQTNTFGSLPDPYVPVNAFGSVTMKITHS